LFFLQAMMPMRRSFSSKVACSRCSTPSGFVPGSTAVGRTWQRRVCGGEGAKRRPGPDWIFFTSCSRVFYAKSQGYVVSNFYSEALSVIVTPPTII
jgi:hypothetical protein